MKRRTHRGKEGYLLFLPVFRDAELLLTKIRNVVSLSRSSYDGNSDQVCIDLQTFNFLLVVCLIRLLNVAGRWFGGRLRFRVRW